MKQSRKTSNLCHNLCIIDYDEYLLLLQLEHRSSTIPLQHTRFWAASHAPFQLSFWALSSASVSRLQLLQGRPLLRFPWGFQLRACRVMLAGGFLSVWPIQPHFLWRICLASGSRPACSHKSVLLILSGHRMPRIRRRQVLTKHWIFCIMMNKGIQTTIDCDTMLISCPNCPPSMSCIPL